MNTRRMSEIREQAGGSAPPEAGPRVPTERGGRAGLETPARAEAGRPGSRFALLSAGSGVSSSAPRRAAATGGRRGARAAAREGGRPGGARRGHPRGGGRARVGAAPPGPPDGLPGRAPVGPRRRPQRRAPRCRGNAVMTRYAGGGLCGRGRAPRCRRNAGMRAGRALGLRRGLPRTPGPFASASLGPGPGSRRSARQDAEAQLGKPVTAPGPRRPGGWGATRGGPARGASAPNSIPGRRPGLRASARRCGAYPPGRRRAAGRASPRAGGTWRPGRGGRGRAGVPGACAP